MTTNHDAVATASWQNESAGAVASVSRARHVASSLSMLLAVAFGGLSVAVVAQLSIEPATYASTSTTTAILDLAAGLGMMAAGCIWWRKQGRGSVGLITTLIGFTWLSADWIAWPDGSDLVRSIAMVAAPFLLPLVVHVSVAFPTAPSSTDRLQACDRLRPPTARPAAISLGWALLRDPFRDRYCWSNCTVNSFLVHANPSSAVALDCGPVSRALRGCRGCGDLHLAARTSIACGRRSLLPCWAAGRRGVVAGLLRGGADGRSCRRPGTAGVPGAL